VKRFTLPEAAMSVYPSRSLNGRICAYGGALAFRPLGLVHPLGWDQGLSIAPLINFVD
jgi:hypothetical protein